MGVKKYKWWVVIAVYLALFGDRHIASAIFYYQCQKGEPVQVFETILLEDEFVVLVSKDEKEKFGFDGRFVLDENSVINKSYFESLYEFRYRDDYKISDFGPVGMMVSSIIRKEDGKVMSKAETIYKKYGWLSNKVSTIFP
ncbi:hypothetical protein [Teredinibacter sp. KSP-S5-2]|uniref:hypothetical protein n=1 Tax=Teredinibacter sp. KSP-S5-2 TaxID=3034506 RepID=UPI002934DFCF|nr:hypothetical protein [Teredinibacter sp. KSP-S5-2]WNO08270.1 hypothetical protein P5V12_14965 [Teredinibacter sp. KSP-S5-2]